MSSDFGRTEAQTVGDRTYPKSRRYLFPSSSQSTPALMTSSSATTSSIESSACPDVGESMLPVAADDSGEIVCVTSSDETLNRLSDDLGVGLALHHNTGLPPSDLEPQQSMSTLTMEQVREENRY